MLIAAVYQIHVYPRYKAHFFSIWDAPSYLKASENLQWHFGGADELRTPVYPCFIATIRYFFDEDSFQKRVVLFQHLISWGCIGFFYHTAKHLFKNTAVAVGASLYCACHPSIMSWNHVIMSESLSVSGIVIISFLLVSYLLRPGYSKAVVIGAVVFLLIMLRPVFLILLPIFFVFWLARCIVYREHRSREAAGLLSIIVALILVVGYCQLFKQKYGYFSISSVTFKNQAAVFVQSGLYRYGSDPAFNKRLIAAEKKWKQKPGKQSELRTGNAARWIYPTEINSMGGTHYVLNAVSPVTRWYGYDAEFRKYVRDSIRKNRLRYAGYLLGRFFGIFGDKFEETSLRGTKTPVPCFSLNLTFISVYVLLLLDTLTIALTLYYSRRIPWFWCISWLLITGTIFVAVVGAYEHFIRLVLPVLPLVILLIAKYVDLIA